jgi:hypothetical protein
LCSRYDTDNTVYRVPSCRYYPLLQPLPPLVDIYAGSKEAIECSDGIRIKNRKVFDLLTQANAARNLIRQDFRKRMVAGSDVQHIIPTGGKNWVIYI